MKKFLCIFAVSLVLIISGMHNSANAIVFDLNYVIEWEKGSVKNKSVQNVFGVASFGTISLNDNGNGVDIVVNLTGAGIHKIQMIALNYDDTTFDSSDPFQTTSGTAIGNDQNNVKAGGYPGLFDLEIPKNGNLGFEPYNDTITLSATNLAPENFDFFETNGFYLASVHVGNFGGEPGVGGDDSMWIGATRQPISELATMLLLGFGLIGIAGFGRKKILKKK